MDRRTASWLALGPTSGRGVDRKGEKLGRSYRRAGKKPDGMPQALWQLTSGFRIGRSDTSSGASVNPLMVVFKELVPDDERPSCDAGSRKWSSDVMRATLHRHLTAGKCSLRDIVAATRSFVRPRADADYYQLHWLSDAWVDEEVARYDGAQKK